MSVLYCKFRKISCNFQDSGYFESDLEKTSQADHLTNSYSELMHTNEKQRLISINFEL